MKSPGSRSAIAFLGVTWCLFLIWSPGYSPQWVLYLLPLILLVAGAIFGAAAAHTFSIEDAELVSILCGLGAASLTFIIVNRVVKSAYFSAFFEPVILNRL